MNFEKARALLSHGIEERAFPGAVFGVWREGEVVALQSVGRFTYAPDSAKMQPATIFDVASLTKVVATTALAMRLWQRQMLPLELPVSEVLPEVLGVVADASLITFEMLLAHTSGLPAHRKLYELPEVVAAQTPEGAATAAMAACFAMPLEAKPGARAEYSDIGFIWLGEALRRLTGSRDLQEICAREVFHPLGLVATCYLPAADLRARIAPTRDWNWRHRVLQGEVQDENCAVLGGIAGHAGVFSTCGDLLKFGAAICGEGDVFQSGAVELFSKRVSGSRALGWDTPSPPSQSGRFFSSRSIGHLGYTGTSLWLDLERRVVVVLLTNRVFTEGGPANQLLQRVRPAFYDAVMGAI